MGDILHTPGNTFPIPENENSTETSVHDWVNALKEKYPADKRHPRVRARLSEVLAEIQGNADESFMLSEERVKKLDKLVDDYADREDDTVLPLILAELKLE